MEVRFVSSLTSEDEERYAPALLAALSGLLGQTNLAYTLQIRTSGDKMFHHSHTPSLERPQKDAASSPGDGRYLSSAAALRWTSDTRAT